MKKIEKEFRNRLKKCLIVDCENGKVTIDFDSSVYEDILSLFFENLDFPDNNLGQRLPTYKELLKFNHKTEIEEPEQDPYECAFIDGVYALNEFYRIKAENKF